MAYVGTLTAAGTNSGALDANTKLATKYTAPSTGFTALWIAAAVSCVTQASACKLGIYSDLGGYPYELLGETDEIFGYAGKNVSVGYFTSPVSITANLDYWLAILSTETTIFTFADALTTGGTSETNADTYSDGFAFDFGSSTAGSIDLTIAAGDGFGPGGLEEGGATFEASDGTKLAVVPHYGGAYLYSHLDSTPVLEDFVCAFELHLGNGTSVWLHAAIDSGDDVHLVSAGVTASTDISYVLATESAGSWTFGTPEEAYNYTQQDPANPGAAISIDASDYPHIHVVDAVKQAGSTQDNVYYTERTGGSWATPTQIGFRNTKTDAYASPSITLRSSDYIEVAYWSNISTGSWAIAYKSNTGTWSSESIYTNYADNNAPGLTATTGGTSYKSWTDDANDILENDSDTTYNAQIPRTSAVLVDDADRYLFYIDTGDDVHLISNDGGGWTDEGDLQVGTYTGIIAGWSYNNLNNTTSIDYLYDNGTNVYYGEYSLTTPASTPPRLRPLRMWNRSM